MSELKVVSAPKSGEKQEVFIQPNEKVKFGFPLDSVKVDILGSDIVFTFNDGAQLVMSNLAISLFSNDAPQMFMGDQQVGADSLLSQIGMVQSVSGRDVALLTSLQVEKNNTSEIDQKVEVLEKILFKVRDNPEVIINPPPTLENAASTFTAGGKQQSQFKKAVDEMLNNRAKSQEENSQTNTGKYTTPPVDPNPPRVQAQVPDPDLGDALGADLVFAARLLQIAPTITIGAGNTLTYLGGTGSGPATLDPSQLTQIQREFIDTTRHVGPATIRADNPTLVQTNLLSRAVEIQPPIPVEYDLQSLRIEGLPVGFNLLGRTRQLDDSYLFGINDLTAGRGPQKFTLQYDPTALGAPQDLDNDGFAREYARFDITIRSVVFNTPNGILLTEDLVVPVIVKDTTTDDFAFVVSGQPGWVLDTKPAENIIVAGDGGITVFGSQVIDRISTGTGNDTITADGGNDIISTSSGNDIINPGTGDNTVDGGDGQDLLTYTGRAEDISIDLGGAQNVVGEITSFVGVSQEDLVKGIEDVTTGTGNDTIQGNGVDNVLTGGDGTDFLMGRGGNDTLAGGNGVDTVSYSYSSLAVTVDLVAGTGVANPFDSDVISGFENIIGSGFNDTLRGDAAANNIQGGDGDDLINGRTGNDVIDGGNGTNTISFADQTSAVTLTLANAGNATATTVGGNSITVANITNIIGSVHDDVLTGNSSNNVIEGGNGNDTLDGAVGTADIVTYVGQTNAITADLDAGTVVKNSGNDTFANFEIFRASNLNDTILGGSLIGTIDGLNGVDTLSYQNSGAIVNVNIATGTTTGAFTHSFSNIENITGGTNNDTLTGDENDNVITGGNGDDVLNGNGGNDTLIGGIGNDTATYATFDEEITFNLGNANLEVLDADGGLSTLQTIETIVGTNFDDTFNSGTTSRTISLNGAGGTDLMSFATETGVVTANLSSNATGAFGTYTFLSNSIENLTGGSNNDILTGSSGNNVISGGLGSDTLNANGGSDTLNGDGGTDTATFATYGAAVTLNLNTFTVTDAAAAVVTMNSIETVTLTDQGDTILSGQVITNTTINGGNGVDTIDFTPLQAALTANLGAGTATIGLGTTYTLQNIENLTGGGLNDLLTGSAGNNTVLGGNGDDIIYGSNGTDILDGGNGYDYYSLHTSFGNAFIAELGANPDVTITDGIAMNLTLRNIEFIGGTDGNDTYRSGAVARSLTLDGWNGTDLLDFSTETTAVNATLDGNATGAFGSYTGIRRIENLTGGSGNDTLTGVGFGSGHGTSQNNVINGGDGDDTLNGNQGTDTLIGGNGFDTATFASITSNITVTLNTTSTATYTVALNNSSASMTTIERILTGSGNDSFTVAGGSLTLSLDAGAGTDSISFAGQSGALNIDLNTTGTGAFGTYTFLNTSFENVTSGSGSDTITGTSVANVIVAGNGTDTVNAGGGNDTIDDSGSTFASNATNILNAEEGDDTVYTFVANNTIAGGNGSDTLRYDNANGFGVNSTAALTFTLAADSSGGTVTDGVRTDNFTSFETFFGGTGNDIFIGGSAAENFNGNNGDDVFRGRGGNNSFVGGNGSDTADYSLATGAVTANLTTNSASNNGDGGTDTFNAIENLTGSDFSDNLTGNATNNVLRGGAGDDTLVGSTGTDTLNGEAGTNDTLTFATSTTALTVDVNTSRITGSSISTDYLNVENINTGTGSDIVNASATNLFANTINFDLGGGAGSDRIVINSVGTVGTDATTFTSRFNNVERLDFLLANTAGGNMVIDGNDVVDITNSSAFLRLDISAAFGLTVQNGTFTTLGTSSLGGGVTQYLFSNGGPTLATLEVHVV